MKSESNKDAWWVVETLERLLPISRISKCECSADILYYLKKIKKELKKK